MKKFILIDAYALIHRAYHALPPLSDKDGEAVNAVFGFASILIKTIGEFKPDYIAAAFDMPEPTFRHKEYAKYKATRPETPPDLNVQIPKVREVLGAFGIPVYEKSGYEADDVIGTISKKLYGRDVEVLILTGDMDTLQLVGKNIKVFTPKRGLSDPMIYDAAKVKERFGGLGPEQMPDFKGLNGDPSDNIPGVKGVGEKTAIDLLNRFKTLENIYKAIDKNQTDGIGQSVLEKLKAGREAAFFSKKLATLDTNVPADFSLKSAEFGKFDKENLFGIFRKFGFVSLIERMKSAGGGQGVLIPQGGAVKQPAEIKYKKVPADAGWGEFIGGLKTAAKIWLAHRIENGELKSLAINTGRDVFLLESGFSNIAGILADEKIKKSGGDFKPLIKALWKIGAGLKGLDFDAALADYVIDPSKRDYGIGKIIAREIGAASQSGADPRQALAFEAEILPKLESALSAQIAAAESEKVFREIEMPLIPVLAEMESAGIKLDVKKLKKAGIEIEKELAALEKEIYESAGEKFNINSPRQLSEILFVKLQISGARAGGRIKKNSGRRDVDRRRRVGKTARRT